VGYHKIQESGVAQEPPASWCDKPQGDVHAVLCTRLPDRSTEEQHEGCVTRRRQRVAAPVGKFPGKGFGLSYLHASCENIMLWKQIITTSWGHLLSVV